MPLPEYSGTLGLKRAAHLLRRATFGANKQQIDTFAGYTPAQAITLLFRQTLPPPVLPIDPQTGMEWVVSGTTDANSMGSDLEGYLLKWIIGQMMSAGVPDNLSLPYSAREKVVHFLHTHFTTIVSKVSSSRALYFQNELFRKFALDSFVPVDPLNPADTNFKKLTVKISVDNAMLRLLDGNLNVKGSVNENYGRELIELYSLGKGLQGTQPTTGIDGDYFYYTEQDVQAAANVLTGWVDDDTFTNIDPDTLLPRGKVKGTPLNAGSHETDETLKVFSTRFTSALFPDNTIRPDPLLLNGTQATEESALDEIDKLVELIYEQEETRRHICWKIYRFYVAAMHTLDDSVAIDSPIITEMANTFRDSGYKLQIVIENLLRSQHFYDSGDGAVVNDNFGGIIKSPLDLAVGTLRFFNFQIPDMTTSPVAFYEATGEILGAVKSQGMNFYEPYDVAGYEAYHQFPIYHRAWITPNSLTSRYAFARNVISAAEGSMFNVNVYNYVRDNIANATAADAYLLVIELAKYLLPITDNLVYDDTLDDLSGLTALRLNYFEKRFVQDFAADPELYWTNRWNAAVDLADMRGQLEVLFNAMLQSPEYQLA
ncbi:MAG TPA: DUF1800 family protein [Chryseolinea sp.]|nr:DUF1800 family protein [Chryseolinea sp.]